MVKAKQKKEGRRLPTVVKKARGTLRPDRENKAEPEVDNSSSVPAPSPMLKTDEGKALWWRVSMQLQTWGLLYPVTYELVERYCMTYERIIKLEKMVGEVGEFVMTKQGIKKHPALAVINETFLQWFAIGRELGLPPVSKSKLIANAGSGNQGKNKNKTVSFRQK